MTFYIASSLGNYERVREASAALAELGHTHSYDWTLHGDVRRQGEQALARVAANESAGPAHFTFIKTCGGLQAHSKP